MRTLLPAWGQSELMSVGQEEILVVSRATLPQEAELSLCTWRSRYKIHPQEQAVGMRA